LKTRDILNPNMQAMAMSKVLSLAMFVLALAGEVDEVSMQDPPMRTCGVFACSDGSKIEWEFADVLQNCTDACAAVNRICTDDSLAAVNSSEAVTAVAESIPEATQNCTRGQFQASPPSRNVYAPFDGRGGKPSISGVCVYFTQTPGGPVPLCNFTPTVDIPLADDDRRFCPCIVPPPPPQPCIGKMELCQRLCASTQAGKRIKRRCRDQCLKRYHLVSGILDLYCDSAETCHAAAASSAGEDMAEEVANLLQRRRLPEDPLAVEPASTVASMAPKCMDFGSVWGTIKDAIKAIALEYCSRGGCTKFGLQSSDLPELSSEDEVEEGEQENSMLDAGEQGRTEVETAP